MALFRVVVLLCWYQVVVSDPITRQLSHSVTSIVRFMQLPARGDVQWFDQKLDHSDSANLSTTWKQRYYEDLSRFQNGSGNPIFLMIGGENSEDGLQNGFRDVLADKLGALRFELEHRFYGESIPNNDTSTKNLRYLSVEQALGDIANFIANMNSKYGFTSDNKWVVFGGSYPGMLAAWVRLKYPKLVHAAVASSAPVWLKLNFKECYEVLRTVLAAYSKQCAENVHAAAIQLEKLLQNPANKDMLMKKLGICDYDPRNEKDVKSFIFNMAGASQGFKNPERLCSIMLDDSLGDLVDRYASLTAPAMGRMWVYQRCTDLGGFATSSRTDELFGSLIDLQFFVDWCQDAYGPEFDLARLTKGIENGDSEYGGLNITNNVSRVVFVQGSNDPLYPQGVCNSTNPLAPAIMIPGTSHCDDMLTPTDLDSHPLVIARKRIENYVKEWLV